MKRKKTNKEKNTVCVCLCMFHEFLQDINLSFTNFGMKFMSFEMIKAMNFDVRCINIISSTCIEINSTCKLCIEVGTLHVGFTSIQVETNMCKLCMHACIHIYNKCSVDFKRSKMLL